MKNKPETMKDKLKDDHDEVKTEEQSDDVIFFTALPTLGIRVPRELMDDFFEHSDE